MPLSLDRSAQVRELRSDCISRVSTSGRRGGASRIVGCNLRITAASIPVEAARGRENWGTVGAKQWARVSFNDLY